MTHQPNHTMTELQTIAHQEQMAAARKEFNDLWEKHSNRDLYTKDGVKDFIAAWGIFLAAKGLK